MRAVFDTNVLIAAFLTDGLCSKLLVRARRKECDLVLSTDILKEFERILFEKFSLSRSELSEAKRLVTEAASGVCTLTGKVEPMCRDRDDDKVLACAKQCNAEYLVTGDQDLLTIKRYSQVQIVSPRTFESLFPE